MINYFKFKKNVKNKSIKEVQIIVIRNSSRQLGDYSLPSSVPKKKTIFKPNMLNIEAVERSFLSF